jgi:hypothetical protein
MLQSLPFGDNFFSSIIITVTEAPRVALVVYSIVIWFDDWLHGWVIWQRLIAANLNILLVHVGPSQKGYHSKCC